MIIACPACATRYVVPDSAIGVEGRTVRCAKCRHSWFQDGPVTELAPAPASPPAYAAAPLHEQAAPSPIAAAETAAATAPAGETVPPDAFAAPPVPPPPADTAPVEDDYSQFDPEPPFRPRRNRLKLWTYAASIFAIFAVGTTFAVSYWGLPDWVPVNRPTFGVQQADLVLDFPPGQQDRRQLPNGTEFFGASGTVTNVGRETRSLSPILIVLRDARDRIVFVWEVAPPQRTLAPGESVKINEAVTDVPKAAKFAEIGWKPN